MEAEKPSTTTITFENFNLALSYGKQWLFSHVSKIQEATVCVLHVCACKRMYICNGVRQLNVPLRFSMLIISNDYGKYSQKHEPNVAKT